MKATINDVAISVYCKFCGKTYSFKLNNYPMLQVSLIVNNRLEIEERDCYYPIQTSKEGKTQYGKPISMLMCESCLKSFKTNMELWKNQRSSMVKNDVKSSRG